MIKINSDIGHKLSLNLLKFAPEALERVAVSTFQNSDEVLMQNTNNLFISIVLIEGKKSAHI